MYCRVFTCTCGICALTKHPDMVSMWTRSTWSPNSVRRGFIMAVSQLALFKAYRNSPRQHVERVISLVLVVVLSLIAASCGTSQNSNSNQQALALSGSLPGGAVNQTYNAVLSVNGGSNPY